MPQPLTTPRLFQALRWRLNLSPKTWTDDAAVAADWQTLAAWLADHPEQKDALLAALVQPIRELLRLGLFDEIPEDISTAAGMWRSLQVYLADRRHADLAGLMVSQAVASLGGEVE